MGERLLDKKLLHLNLNNGFQNGFALNKRTADRNPVSTRQNEAFDKKSISISWKDWFTPNFENGIHQEKEALDKRARFVIKDTMRLYFCYCHTLL